MLTKIYIGFSTIIADYVTVVQFYDDSELLRTDVSRFQDYTILEEYLPLLIDEIINQCDPVIRSL